MSILVIDSASLSIGQSFVGLRDFDEFLVRGFIAPENSVRNPITQWEVIPLTDSYQGETSCSGLDKLS